MLEKFDIEIINEVIEDKLSDITDPDVKEEYKEQLIDKVDAFTNVHQSDWVDQLDDKFDISSDIDDLEFKRVFLDIVRETEMEKELIETVINLLENEGIDLYELDNEMEDFNYIKSVFINIVEETDSEELVDIVLL